MRHQSKPHSFEDQLAVEKERLEREVAKLPGGSERDALVGKIRQLDTAGRINAWLSSRRLSMRTPVPWASGTPKNAPKR
jgi:hypothetical protein